MDITKGVSFSEETIKILEEQAIKDSDFDKLEKRNMLIDALRVACINSNIPERYASSGFHDYEEKTAAQKRFKNEMKSIFEKINAGETVNAVLCGTFGIGKTHLSCAILRGLLQSKSVSYGPDIPPYYNNNLFYYVRSDEIRQEMSDAKKYSTKKTQTDVIDKYSKYKCLVIDEVGGTADERAEKDLLYRLLHNRYENKSSTIMIANKTFIELCEFLGGAITDRLREKSVIVDCTGIESYRGEK